MKEITERLKELADPKYKEFHKGLFKEMDTEHFFGVRTPVLRALAKELIKDGRAGKFIAELPHEYYDEYQLHVMILSELKDYETVIAECDRVLPYVNNWATCDQLRPKCFRKNRDRLIGEVMRWYSSDEVFTKRFAIGMLLGHYLGEDFKPEYMELVSKTPTEEYYLHMMVAWYFAEAFAKQPEAALPYIEQQKLDKKTHNKAIQKACESFRVPDDTKEYLRKMRR